MSGDITHFGLPVAVVPAPWLDPWPDNPAFGFTFVVSTIRADEDISGCTCESCWHEVARAVPNRLYGASVNSEGDAV